MYFLKKASISDILGVTNSENIFDSGIRVTEHYKEYELYLTMTMLDDCFLGKKLNADKVEQLKKRLDTCRAAIRAVHCPESRYLTSCDQGGLSTNYLSLQEAACDKESFQRLRKTLLLAKEFSGKAYPVLVVLHAGSINGCKDGDILENINTYDFVKQIQELGITKQVKIVIENVTPFYNKNRCDNTVGLNRGWGSKFIEDAKIIDELNEILKNNQCTNIQFGLCIDFCHLMADFSLKQKECLEADSCSTYMKKFIDKLNHNHILLFHVSKYDEDGGHGALFRHGNKEDEKILETIKSICAECPAVPVTLEMSDGMNPDKACANFDRMMYVFSCTHRYGKLGEMLDTNTELKAFFENLFLLYSIPVSNIYKLQEVLFEIKRYTLNNTPENMKNFFNFTKKEDCYDLARLRLLAYIFYTRFCNLGSFLAGVYAEADFLTDKKADFSDTLKYFMFCDYKILQCVFTGVGYAFNMDLLPKKVRLYRFNDGIEEGQVRPFQPIQGCDCFGQMVDRVRSQICGLDLTMYSLGKNFYSCLNKYYSDKHNWSLRIYDNLPINIVRIGEEKMSLPAFLLRYQYKKEAQLPVELHFSMDVSTFRRGRDGEESDSLHGFIENNGCEKKGIINERVGSIADGEVVFTELPEASLEARLTLDDACVMLKACCIRPEDRKMIKRVRINKVDNNKKYFICYKRKAKINLLNKIMDGITVDRRSIESEYKCWDDSQNLSDRYEEYRSKIKIVWMK